MMGGMVVSLFEGIICCIRLVVFRLPSTFNNNFPTMQEYLSYILKESRKFTSYDDN